MTNSTIYNTAHTQRQSNRQPRKRKRLAEITGSSKLSKHVLADATSSKCRRLYPLIPTPPLTEELTPRKAADTVSYGEHYNCDHIWDLIRESKAKQYPSNVCRANLCLATMNAKDDSTTMTGKTTAIQPSKEQPRYAEEMLHPRWISIQYEKGRNAKPLSVIQRTVREALDGEQSPDFKSIIGDEMFTSIDEGHGALIKSKLTYLRKSHASEAQWEACLWRRWFLKDSLQDLDGDSSDSKPFMGQIVQARMLLSPRGGVLPPLLASADDRRKSGLFVAPVPWAPNLLKQKGNHILWYPDYLYAVSQSSLQSRIQDFDVDDLPAFRIAQYKYLPGNWIAEIKSDNSDPNKLAAEHYSAFLSAYLLHERLLLHWIAKNESFESNNPVKFDDSLAIHCITCCGSECRIWRMSIRAKETTSLDLKPVRYDMQLLDSLDVETANGDQRLCDWINTLNALALTVQFKSIIADLEGIQANESRLFSAHLANRLSPTTPHTYSWISNVGFVYNTGSTAEICVAPLGDLRKAFNNGDIEPVGQIGDKVIQWDEKGQPLEVDITGMGEQALEPGASSTLSSAPPTGNAWMTQFTAAELRRLSSPAVKRIATALTRINSGGNIGSTKKEHTKYITEAQQALAEGGMRMDIWKKMQLTRDDLNKLRVDHLQIICKGIGTGDLGSTAAKGVLVKALESL